MRKIRGQKKYMMIIVVLVLLIFSFGGVFFYWKIPSRREAMTWARSLQASDVSKIELTVMPSAEDERYRIFEEDEFDDIIALINKSTGRFL